MELIETIFYDKELKNLNLHINRAKKSAKFFKWKFNENEWLDLSQKFNFPQKKLRVRVTYNEKGIKCIELFEIKKREFNSFRVVEIDFNYSHKFKNRKNFEKLHKIYKEDEFILVKNGLITDTTISNLAFFTGSEWLTPKYPLLKGTKREELIQKGFLKEENIKPSDIKYFKKFAMLNAILGFKEIGIECIKY